MRTDPFAMKNRPKWHPERLAFTTLARVREWESRREFERYQIPDAHFRNLPSEPVGVDWAETSVTPFQMRHLIEALKLTEGMMETVVAEIGSYRGETTRCLAQHTNRPLIAVDPYSGYGGAEDDLRRFESKTIDLPNVQLKRMTSGDAARNWSHGPISFVFIDAVHDYVNTSFDLDAWSELVVPRGIIALHDTDQPQFAGTRRAAFESLGRFELLAHPDNLTLLRNC